uniref:ATP synthase F0 subunit 6 n=1 Tax=Gongylonema pulchrum TaxID=637853 RepID=A0A0D3MTI8_9BILA|nr:ATP synthase F0 subunit 6 [Gongylonema pulchrum]AIY56390.1 ATP synthase F0 subunit 6 [Gongylonema pulchrum]
MVYFFFYLLMFQLIKIGNLGLLNFFSFLFMYNFEHQGLQSSIFFKVSVLFLIIFWMGGMFFPLFSPWSCIGFLFFLTNFSWLSARTFTLVVFNFMLFFEEEHLWNWLSSVIMFFSHWLSFLMSAVALTLRISIIFLMGHFLMFFLMNNDLLLSFFFLMFILPVELFFAFLQSYIFLTLICMFLLNMIC